MKKIIAILSCIFMFIIISFSAAEEKSPKSFTETFLVTLKEGKISQAYDQLFVGSDIPISKPQAVDLIKSQTESMLPLYGKIIGFELIQEEKFGTSIVRLVYVLKMEKVPTVWEFYFYKPKTTWFLGNLLFNDQFNLLESKK